jgi:hypothetical protein
MAQIALPFSRPDAGEPAIAVGLPNAAVVDALARPATWPYRTAILAGPPRSGKSLIARWFAGSGAGEAIDDADTVDETELFHRWNAAQESGTALLLVSGRPPGEWGIALPDLASRLGAALHLEIGAPDDAFLGDLLAAHAAQRGFVLGADAAAYLVPRTERSHAAAEALVAAIDRLSLERKAPPTLAIWRDALDTTFGQEQPRLL